MRLEVKLDGTRKDWPKWDTPDAPFVTEVGTLRLIFQGPEKGAGREILKLIYRITQADGWMDGRTRDTDTVAW